jgi:mRNA-degrading endonuclease HigB of HigAB toxin-antitoxin module
VALGPDSCAEANRPSLRRIDGAGGSTAYRTASILRNNRAAFNVKGNTYRLVVAVKYEFQVVYIRFIGTHVAYDNIKAEEV